MYSNVMDRSVTKRKRELLKEDTWEGKRSKVYLENRLREPHEVNHSGFNWPTPSGGDYKEEHFHLGLWLNPLKKVKVYLPKLKLPESLNEKDEKAMVDLQILLRGYGFDVTDRPTLAFFALGKQLNIWAAVNCFKEFYTLASTLLFRFPDLSHVEQLVADRLIEGFASQSDGTAGLCIKPSQYHGDPPAMYVVREMLCHILHMTEFSLLKKGTTEIANMRDLAWRNFFPLIVAEIGNCMKKCNPIFKTKILMVDSNWYATVAYKVLYEIMPSSFTDFLQILSLREARDKFPSITLPPSLSSSTSSNIGFCHLSVDDQISFQLMIDNL